MAVRAYKAMGWVKHNDVDYFPGGDNRVVFAEPHEVMGAVGNGSLVEDPNIPIPAELTEPIATTTVEVVPVVVPQENQPPSRKKEVVQQG